MKKKNREKNHTLFAINALQDTTLRGGIVHREWQIKIFPFMIRADSWEQQ